VAKTDRAETKGPQRLIDALAEKGGPGLILQGIIFLVVWGPLGLLLFEFFDLLGSPKDFSGLSWRESLIAPITSIFAALIYLFVAYQVTMKVLTSIIPTIRAEAEAAALMSGELGGRIVTAAGTVRVLAIGSQAAETRIKQIMRALLERYQTVVGFEGVRANIFTLREDGWLRIQGEFHLNMKGGTPDDQELSISIPNGLLSSGRAFKYSRPILSLKGDDGRWPYPCDTESAPPRLQQELAKVHKDLKWITSMPIPYQVRPFELVSGVLNVDGLESLPSTAQLRPLLADLSTAAALIGMLNRSTGIFSGGYGKPSEPPDLDKEQLREHLINPDEFDPASCPEPTRDFVLALSRIQGLEFFASISPAETANYIREQLGT
jgi:hypothetical protein